MSQSRPQHPSRREFLGISAAAVATLASGTQAWASQGTGNRRPRIAAIGVGGKGWSNIEGAAQFGDVAALCDVDSTQIARGLQQWKSAKTYRDFRVMLAEMEDEIDVVLVSTPDHTHSVAAAAALRLRKAVYVEKPLSRTIWEARELGKIARRAGTPTQMGNQFTASDNLRRIAAHLKARTWGEVKEIHCWTNRPGGWWPQGVDRGAPKTAPSTVDFDLWLGPSPERPYADNYHPFAWRGWWDFGTGAMGDIACHCMNLPFMAYNLRDPLTVQAVTSGHNRDSYPLSARITYEFGATKDHPALELTWSDGGRLPSPRLAPNLNYESNGCLIVCEKATLYSPGEYAGSTQIVGGGEIPDIDFVKSPGHMAELFQALNGGPTPVANIPNYAAPMTEMALVGNLAVWADGPKLQWDARAMKVKGTDEYDSLIRPTYRKGWKL
jgi:predicted dehydrogenase